MVVDNEAAGRMAAGHLIELGHRRIAVITGAIRFNDRQRGRMMGVRQALEAHGLALPPSLTCEEPTTLAGGRMGCAKLLELADPPTAIIGGIDLIAIGCMVEAQARGLAVPGDLSVVGIDDLDMSAHVTPALTTIHIPTTGIGAEAAGRIVRLIRGAVETGSVTLPIELVVRRSTAPPRGA